MSARMIWFSLLALLVFMLIPIKALAVDEAVEPLTREALTDTIIREKFFRKPIGVLWTIFGEERSYAIEMRYGFVSDEILPNPFGQLGLIPTAIVGDVLYNSNPAGEDGDVIWSHVIAYYDNLFDYSYLEGRVIYDDIQLASYLGVGIGYVPVNNSWLGGYYLGGEGFMLAAEGAKAFGDKIWLYGNIQYYTENDDWQHALEGEVGLVYDNLVYVAVQNRKDKWLYMVGASYSLE